MSAGPAVLDCLCCGIGSVTAYTRAGLCVACRIDVENGELIPLTDARGRVRLVWSATSFVVMTRGDLEPYPDPILYDPAPILPPDPTEAEVAEVLDELLTIGLRKPYLTLRDEAVYLIDAIRRCGVTVRIDVQYGSVEFDRPRRIPYPLLVRYLELRAEVEDALTYETARDLEDRRRAYGLIASRFGPHEAGREFPDVARENEGADCGEQAEFCETGSGGMRGVQKGQG